MNQEAFRSSENHERFKEFIKIKFCNYGIEVFFCLVLKEWKDKQQDGLKINRNKMRN